MLSANPLPSQFPREQAHLKRQQKALFAGHRLLNPELNRLRRRACVGERHEQILPRRFSHAFHVSDRQRSSLSPGNGPDNDKRFLPRDDRLRQRSIRRFVGQILLTRKEPQERPALQGDVIADGSAQHGIAGLKRIKNRPLRDRGGDFEFYVTVDTS
jgi:hypothetical protein